MASIVNVFLEWLNPRKMKFWLFLVIIVLFFGAYYVYIKNYRKIADGDKRNNIPNSGSSDDIKIMIFTVDWCPHCKSAKAPWDDFKAGYHNKTINGKLITCIKYDLTEGNANYDLSKEAADKYKIEGYPTVKMIKGSQVIDFDAKISSYALEKFVENMT